MIGVRRNTMRKTRSTVSSTLLLLVTGLILLSVFLMLLDSVRSNAEVASHPVGWPTSLEWRNYVLVVQPDGLSQQSEELDYRYRGFVGVVASSFAGLTIPVFVLSTPLYLLVQELGLLDKLVAVILIYAAFHLPFAIFFYVSFLRSVPEELEQAAAGTAVGPS